MRPTPTPSAAVMSVGATAPARHTIVIAGAGGVVARSGRTLRFAARLAGDRTVTATTWRSCPRASFTCRVDLTDAAACSAADRRHIRA
jgi:hypothetical protein